MALSSSFRERLELMDQTRRQRLSLLHAEKQLQETKYAILLSKAANIRSMEQKCLLLERQIAEQKYKVLSIKSKMEELDVEYKEKLEKIRILKSEVAALEELEKKKNRYYEDKGIEMEEFNENVDDFVMDCRMTVEEFKQGINKMKTNFSEIQGNCVYSTNSEIAEAELRKTELLAMKEKLQRSLASNYQLRGELQRQLQNKLVTDQDRTKISQLASNKTLDSKSRSN